MEIFYKIKWVIGVLMIFALIFATNQLDKDNFKKIKNSIDTIYKDRLVASDILFDMSSIVHDLEVQALTVDDPVAGSAAYYKELKQLVNRFAETRLTDEEEILFADLEYKLDLLTINEDRLDGTAMEKSLVLSKIAAVKTTLGSLSKIQLKEGRAQIFISDRVIDNIEFTTQVEFYMLVILAVIIQVIVMYTPRRRRKSS